MTVTNSLVKATLNFKIGVIFKNRLVDAPVYYYLFILEKCSVE